MTRIFTGDYAAGDFRSWPGLSNTFISAGSTRQYGKNFPPQGLYSAQVLSEDKDAGYIGRTELRQNDRAFYDNSSVARSEVSTTDEGIGTSPIGSTRWYALSLKFDPNFPTNHHDLGWGVIEQFHGIGGYSPSITLGWANQSSLATSQSGNLGFRTGYWYLHWVQWPTPTTPGVALPAHTIIPVFEFPFNLGQWHDLKMQIKWEQNNTGFIRLWWQGQQRTLYGGVDTVVGPTVPPNLGTGPNQSNRSAQMGYYRPNTISVPGVIYNANFRMASTEAGL